MTSPLNSPTQETVDVDFHVRFLNPRTDPRPDQFCQPFSTRRRRSFGSKKFDHRLWLLAQTRLFPDMHPLVRQVQIACDTAKGAAGRLAGVEVPKHEDTEATFADLKTRIAKTLDFVKSVTPAQLQGAETRAIEIKFPNGSWKFTGVGYLTDFVASQFLFPCEHGLRLVAQERR